MNKRLRRWDRLVPAGMDGPRELRRLAAGLSLSLVWSVLAFLLPYGSAWRGRWGRMVFPRFDDLLSPALIPFAVTAGGMLALALVHVLSHYQGSRSVYLMRRLPDRRELWRRCLSVPLLGLGAAAVLAAALGGAYFWVYRTCTPPELFPDPADQGPWYELLRAIFCGP